ncbi:MAG TPA: pentapeptide repeat-containing protein [Chthoniobacterales bacterium]|nr:pentapeptide repeat-containing protein [Chthoniobacterales bacterium]
METEQPTELTLLDFDSHQVWLESGGKEGNQASVDGANFRSCKELQGKDLRNALLNKAVFKNANLTGTNLQGAELRRAGFSGAILRRTNLREADLQNADLEKATYLLTSQLAGADVTGAKLPPAIAEFKGLETIAEATSNAQKLFIAMLGGCLYSWLTIGTTKDAALLTNSASSPLPIIGTALPIVGFYTVAPIVLLAMYFYFHLNMQRLWEALADLPAIFPDGRSLDKRADPWLLNGLVSAHFARLRRERPSLSRVQQWLSILLVWWVVPATLFVFWGRFLVRHDWSGTDLHIFLLAIAGGFGVMSYRLARNTLRGLPRARFLWANVWMDFRTYKRVGGVLVTCLGGAVLYLVSLGAINGVPFDQKQTNVSAYNLSIVVPRVLKTIGLTPFANLVEEDVSTKSPDWTGEASQYSLVKGARLREANMNYANARRAFFANADLRLAQLSNAHLEYVDFWSADLTHANLRNAELSSAKLLNTKLTGVDLSNADLEYTSFWQADLSQARLIGARVVGGNLSKANLMRADLRYADLQLVSFVEADLRWADLSHANLLWADLLNAKLFKANLSGANLEGADFSGVDLKDVTGLTRTQIGAARTNEKTVLPGDLPP